MCAPLANEEKQGAFEKFHPVETKRASEAIFEQVKNLIMRGELKPGDRLPSERNMMELFHRSRPTVREALRMLERSGYIRTIPGSNGAVVLKPNNKLLENSLKDALMVGHISLADISEYRRSSEVTTVIWAVHRRTEEDIQAMEQYLADMKNSIDDYETFISMDSHFHGLLAAASQNKVSTIFNRAFSKINQAFMKDKLLSLPPEEQHAMACRVQAMHEAIFEAVRDQDEERAKAVMIAHMDAFSLDLQ